MVNLQWLSLNLIEVIIVFCSAHSVRGDWNPILCIVRNFLVIIISICILVVVSITSCPVSPAHNQSDEQVLCSQCKDESQPEASDIHVKVEPKQNCQGQAD